MAQVEIIFGQFMPSEATPVYITVKTQCIENYSSSIYTVNARTVGRGAHWEKASHSHHHQGIEFDTFLSISQPR